MSCTNTNTLLVTSHLNSRYIGFTTTTLSKRITAHLQDGAIRCNYVNEHGIVLKRKHKEQNAEILEKIRRQETQDDII
ncbi:hypothetical protein E2C01_079732 [Portunus trituberculatus]|uniref:Uncharacterized protein n=1 Tax=Portunus trituberculatus TaxID=210409 RepID=A0A5B7ITK5_PORTR|nr:hypothetical protein [Portunus trituberculatus]